MPYFQFTHGYIIPVVYMFLNNGIWGHNQVQISLNEWAVKWTDDDDDDDDDDESTCRKPNVTC